MQESPSYRHPIDVLSEEFLERFRAGESPSPEEYADQHSELAEEIRDLFPVLVEMEAARPDSTSRDRQNIAPFSSLSSIWLSQAGGLGKPHSHWRHPGDTPLHGSGNIQRPGGRAWRPAGEDPSIVIVDAETGDVRHHWTEPLGAINEVAWRPDGKRLAVVSLHSFQVWDPDSGEVVFAPRVGPGRNTGSLVSGRIANRLHREGTRHSHLGSANLRTNPGPQGSSVGGAGLGLKSEWRSPSIDRQRWAIELRCAARMRTESFAGGRISRILFGIPKNLFTVSSRSQVERGESAQNLL
jgi:hypothetical protein